MSAIDRASAAYVGIRANTLHSCVPMADRAGRCRNVVRCGAVVLAAASLAACAQSSVVSRRSTFVAPSREARLEPHRSVLYAPHATALAPRPHRSVVAGKNAATHVASRGLASYYTEGTRTADGEKFDPNELTAAHPTLPFGTRLRVTNMSTGRSVTVRVNDRGPFVKGRVVDVSYSAARALGMVNSGVANVKLDVVQ